MSETQLASAILWARICDIFISPHSIGDEISHVWFKWVATSFLMAFNVWMAGWDDLVVTLDSQIGCFHQKDVSMVRAWAFSVVFWEYANDGSSWHVEEDKVTKK